MGTEEETYAIKYDPLVLRRDIPALDAFWEVAVRDVIAKKLSTRPDVFGKPLRQSLAGWRSLRVGDYRVVYEIRGQLIVYVLGIIHRSEVYGEIAKRLGL